MGEGHRPREDRAQDTGLRGAAGWPQRPRDGKQALMDSATTANLGHWLGGRKPPARLCRRRAESHPPLSGSSGGRGKPKQLLVFPKRNFLPTRSWCSTRHRGPRWPSRRQRAQRVSSPPSPNPAHTHKVGSEAVPGPVGIQTSTTANADSWARCNQTSELLSEAGFLPNPVCPSSFPTFPHSVGLQNSNDFSYHFKDQQNLKLKHNCLGRFYVQKSGIRKGYRSSQDRGLLPLP